MSYIITGAAGFIGSHLTDALLHRGEQVVAVDNLTTGSLENLDAALQLFPKSFRFVRADVRQAGILEQIISPGDSILHLAATVGVKKCVENADETWRNNFRPTETLLEIARRKRCKLLIASTSEVYGDAAGRRALREDDPASVHPHLGGRSAYILGKLMSEHVCLNAHQSDGTAVVVSRLFNTVGPRQSHVFGMVVPTFLRQAMRGEPIEVFGDGSQTRSFTDVRDTTEAMIRLLECPGALGEVVNIGNAAEMTILELAEFVRNFCGSRSEIRLLPLPPERAGGRDIVHRKPCVEKLHRLTGWAPGRDLAESLEFILENGAANSIGSGKIDFRLQVT